MGMTDELRDIKALLSEINQNNNFDSTLEYLNSAAITQMQNENANVFQKIDEDAGDILSSGKCMVILDLPEKQLLELTMQAHAKNMTLNDFIIMKLDKE
jgi:hypothetical protein